MNRKGFLSRLILSASTILFSPSFEVLAKEKKRKVIPVQQSRAELTSTKFMGQMTSSEWDDVINIINNQSLPVHPQFMWNNFNVEK